MMDKCYVDDDAMIFSWVGCWLVRIVDAGGRSPLAAVTEDCAVLFTGIEKEGERKNMKDNLKFLFTILFVMDSDRGYEH
jgi:hypothetical protein